MKYREFRGVKTRAAAGCLLLILLTPLFGQRLDYLPKSSFYKSYGKHSLQNINPAHLPVAIDEKVSEEFFYQGREKALQPLVEVMNRYLDSLGHSATLEASAFPRKGSPYVFVGSSEAETAPPGSEMMREEHHDFPPMVIYVRKPSKEWKGQLKQQLPQQNAECLLAIWVGFVEYPKARKGLFKKKVVLGTNYEPEIRFLSAEDKPVEVLQVSGMLLNREGEVLRAGAEGIYHEDTPFWAQIFDIEKSVDDAALQNLISNQRREDLPGKPLAWQAALDMLIGQLTGSFK